MTAARYTVEGLLGTGGFARVYRARDTLLGRVVALKVLLAGLADDAQVTARFLQEARALAALRHPNIVTLYDVCEHEGLPAYAMELIDGEPLSTVLLAEGPLPLPRAAAIVMALADALAVIHAAGIVHRDVKPANVMMERSGRAVLMDFGIALTPEHAVRTRSGALLGSPQAMSPEQIRGEPVGPAADVYALGALAYQMLSGRQVFSGDLVALLRAHVDHLPVPLAHWRPDLPGGVCAAIHQALAKLPSQRPGPRELALALATPAAPAPTIGRLSPRSEPATAEDGGADVRGHGGNVVTQPLRILPRPAPRFRWRRRWNTGWVVLTLMMLAVPLALAAVALLRPGGSGPMAAKSRATASPAAATVATSALPVIVTAAPNTTTAPVPGVAPARAGEVTVSLLAGVGSPGYAEGAGAAARFAYPQGVAVDGAGNVAVPDLQNHRIRRIAPSGAVTTLAGDGQPGFVDGAGGRARFNRPAGIAVDSAGNVYVSDFDNHSIRRVTPEGQLTTLAGDGTTGVTDGQGAQARFNQPAGLAVDGTGNVYVADLGNRVIRRIAPDGTVSTVAGGASGPVLLQPSGVAVDGAGNLWIADFGASVVWRIGTDGSRVAIGSGGKGLTDGPAATARFNGPTRLAADGAGNVIVADLNNHAIRRIAPDGGVTTLAGDGTRGAQLGAGTQARLYNPEGVAVGPDGSIYVADAGNHRILLLGRTGR